MQPKVWALIFKLAKDLNVQVFATTHSWDCVTTFQQVSQDREEEVILFQLRISVITTNMGQVIARVYDKESLQRVTLCGFGGTLKFNQRKSGHNQHFLHQFLGTLQKYRGQPYGLPLHAHYIL